jgi:hypothetical protein
VILLALLVVVARTTFISFGLVLFGMRGAPELAPVEKVL